MRCFKPGPSYNHPPFVSHLPSTPSSLPSSYKGVCSIDIQQWPPPTEDDGSGLPMYTQHFERTTGGRVLCRCENVFRRLSALASVADGRIARAVSQVIATSSPLPIPVLSASAT